MINVNLDVNGERVSASVGPTETLLTSLRERLHLTGAKRGCDYGVCGACTVLAGGKPVRSCLALTWTCESSAITTIESLDADGMLAPVQQALLDAGGVQCGFCTAGVVLSAQALLANNPLPSRAEVREAMSANTCRCSGYNAIIDAVIKAAEAAR